MAELLSNRSRFVNADGSLTMEAYRLLNSIQHNADGAISDIAVNAPLTTTGGGTPTLSILPATITDAGSMSAADKVTINNQSGTNTGDQASIVGITGTLAEFNAALTGADFATGGGTATGTNTGDQIASTVPFTPAGGIAAVDVQAAIVELDTEKQPIDADLTSWAAVTRAAGYDTFAATPSSVNLKALVTDETGSGALVFANTPTLVAPLLGTPTSGDFSTGTFNWPTFNQNTTGSAAKWTTARNLAGNSVDGSANVTFANKFIVQGTADAGLSAAQFLGALGTGIVKNTTTTGVLSIAIAADFPTLNQSTTGSAATLTTPRAIYGNNFDGSAALTAIIASTFGGTGNGFTKFSGPATAEKTFTLPNASAVVLTDNAAVTVAQGGSGRATGTTPYALIAVGTTATGPEQSLAAGATTEILVGGGAAALPVWTTAQGSGAPVRATSPTITTPTVSGTATMQGLIDASGAAAGQIKFPAAQNASADANTLDDYEEVDWTPVLAFATPGTSSFTYAAAGQVGKATKVGRKVLAEFQIVTSAYTLGTGSGILSISGLPYAPGAALSRAGSLIFQGITKATYTQFSPAVTASATTITLRACGSGVGQTDVTAADMPSGGSLVFRGSIEYSV